MRCVINIMMLLTGMINSYAVFAQQLSNKGKEFWAGYGHHQFMEPGIAGDVANKQNMQLCFVAEDVPAHVIVTIDGIGYKEEYDVPAHGIIKSRLLPRGLPESVTDSRLYTPPVALGGTGSEGVFAGKGIHIVSNVAIVCYAGIYSLTGVAMSLLLPVETWGYSYVSAATRQLYNTTSNADCFSWIYVVAKENDTRVKIVPSVPSRNGRRSGESFEVTLQKGDVYQLLGAAVNNEEGYDLSGTTVTSISNEAGKCKPVAVFAGSSGTAIACTATGKVSGDNLMQQVFPAHAWGLRYVTAPTSQHDAAEVANVNVYRITVKDPETVVTKNGMRLYGLNGTYYEFQSNKADYIEADQPVMVAQYIPSENNCFYTGKGDPELIYISPLEQAVKQTVFYRGKGAGIEVNYLTLVIPDEGMASLKIDGVLNAYTTRYPHPNLPGYTVVVKRWEALETQCTVESEAAFTGITYGLGSNVSYGYNAGTNLQPVSGKAAIRNVKGAGAGDNAYTCVNTPVTLSLLMRYQPVKIQWQLSALSAVLTPAQDVVADMPVANSVVQINGQIWYRYSLPKEYRFKATGFFTIPVLTTNDGVATCDHTEQIAYIVEVRKAPVAGFSIAYEHCNDLQQVSFTGDSLFTGGEVVQGWSWIFTGSGEMYTADGKKATQQWTPGDYTLQLTTVSEEGCVADTTRLLSLSGKPHAAFTVAPVNVCVGEEQVFTDKSTITTGLVTSWFWRFSDGTTSSVQYPVKRFANAGSYTAALTVVSDQGCEAEPARQDVEVYPLPVIDAGNSFTTSVGSAVRLQATAVDTSNTRFEWTPVLGLSDAHLLNPLLHVLQDQAYTLTATNQYGCTSSDVMTIAVLKPVEVPDVFSPNGDGINDKWVIPHLSEYPGATVSVYNRYGQVVFYSRGYSSAWDGTVNGSILPAGVYYYIIQLKNGTGNLQGGLTLLR